jgi:hypothetical protein
MTETLLEMRVIVFTKTALRIRVFKIKLGRAMNGVG